MSDTFNSQLQQTSTVINTVTTLTHTLSGHYTLPHDHYTVIRRLLIGPRRFLRWTSLISALTSPILDGRVLDASKISTHTGTSADNPFVIKLPNAAGLLKRVVLVKPFNRHRDNLSFEDQDQIRDDLVRILGWRMDMLASEDGELGYGDEPVVVRIAPEERAKPRSPRFYWYEEEEAEPVSCASRRVGMWDAERRR